MDNIESKKKHKKKRKHSDTDKSNNEKDLNPLETQSISVESVEDTTQQSKHKKKKKKSHTKDDEEVSSRTIDVSEGNLENSEIYKKSKKKKKRYLKEAEDEKSTETNVVETEINNLNPDEHQGSEDVDCQRKKKKKSKKHKRELEISEEKSSQDQVNEQPHSKKTKLDIATCSERPPNYVKSTVQESESNDPEVKTGQWSSAELGGEDRQNKFMRLLGGFKKGNDSSQIQKKFGFGSQNQKLSFGSSQKLGLGSQNRPGGNFAMNKQQQDEYNKNLESDYERAMGMNLNRGVGLGFQKPPEEGKKFYIDTKSSKSIKFD